VVPALEIVDRLALFHSQYICPPVSAVPEIVSIHDVLFETHPDLFAGAFSRVSVSLIRRSARRARRVLTGSEFSRRSILEQYGLPEERVVTIPDAVDGDRFRPLAEKKEGELIRVKDRYKLEHPYILNVGRIEPRKNLVRLIRAFRRAREKVDSRLQLILVGKKDFRFDEIDKEIGSGPDTGVRMLGPVPDEDLPALYNLASLFAFPSLVEGFGMPVLESMACGTPVVSSRRGSLPEVGGDAVSWVEPEDEDAIALAIELILTDTDRAARLRKAGLERARRFSWESTARRTLEIYRQCA
jgi:glycosyltransferase involved in cell wall biosynthesis